MQVAAFRRLQQYTQYGQPLTTGNGAANDADVGWTSSDANGYSAVPVTCDAGLVQCHGRCAHTADSSTFGTTAMPVAHAHALIRSHPCLGSCLLVRAHPSDSPCRADCVDLSTNPLYCGTCQTNCDFFTQICQAGACTCKQGFSPCPTRGGRCLDAESCPPGPSPASSTSPTPQVTLLSYFMLSETCSWCRVALGWQLPEPWAMCRGRTLLNIHP